MGGTVFLPRFSHSSIFHRVLVIHIPHNSIPMMAPCRCFLQVSLHLPTMTAVFISAWGAPITHGHVRSHRTIRRMLSLLCILSLSMCAFPQSRQAPSPDIGTAVHVPAMLRANSRDGDERQGLAVGPVRGPRSTLHDMRRPATRER
jgi:hypothetical protein